MDYYIDILKGVPKNYWGNAFIMQSNENVQYVLKEAENLTKYYLLSKDKAVKIILDNRKLDVTSDFTDLDKRKIEDWIREV